MALEKALICAYAFDDSGAAAPLDARGVESRSPGAGWLWIHLDRTQDETETWLCDSANLPPLVIEALLEEETRPRCVAMADGLLVILRGVNLNPGAEPDDMVSVRLWIDQARVISLRRRKLMAIQDMRESIAQGDSPRSPADLLVEITGLMIDRMNPVIENLNEEVDDIEERVLEAPSQDLRSRLSHMRRQAISLRRYLAPQRETLARLHTERTSLLSDAHRNRLREITDRLTRYIEELDSARDRAAVTQEELGGRISDQMNKNMYVLSIVAGVFLPLGLLTGLLGINVGGMPGTQSDWGFAIVCIILVLMLVAVLWLFRKMRLL